MTPARREGHGFWAYLLPMFAFLVLVEIAKRAPEAAAPWLFVLKVAVPLGLFLHFWRQGGYPELDGWRPTAGSLAADVGVGLAGAALWIAPYLLFEPMLAWATEDPDAAFDPRVMGPSLAGAAIAVRALGFAVATPFVEELFVRSWLLRYVDVVDRRADFRDVPIGRFTLRSFVVVMVYFVFSHVPWEYPVMFVWALGTQLWLYHRRQMASLVVVHATTNGAILAFVAVFSGSFRDATGAAIDLWFFV